jgi:N-acetylglutamate synthase
VSERLFLDGLPLGTRVVIRYRLPGQTGPSGGPLATDVIGLLRAWSSTEIEIERRDGTLVRVDQSAIVAAKPVPPPPTRR